MFSSVWACLGFSGQECDLWKISYHRHTEIYVSITFFIPASGPMLLLAKSLQYAILQLVIQTASKGFNVVILQKTAQSQGQLDIGLTAISLLCVDWDNLSHNFMFYFIYHLLKVSCTRICLSLATSDTKVSVIFFLKILFYFPTYCCSQSHLDSFRISPKTHLPPR